MTTPVPQRSVRAPRRLPALAAGLGLGLLAGPAAGALAGSTLGLPSPALEEDGPARSDHVSYVNKRGNLVTLAGRVLQSSLDEVLVEVDGETRTLDSSSVRRIDFGQTPPAFRDGVAYFERHDYPNAAASYRLAAADPIARPPVQAEARLRAAKSELLAGALDPEAFARARDEAERFLVDYPSNRGVPGARFLEARASRLAGESASAAEKYRALFREVESGTPGYPPLVGYRAGISAAEAFLAVSEVDQARKIFNAIESSVPRALAALDEGDPARQELAALQADARLGEGFCTLAEERIGAAKTFFEGQLREAQSSGSLALLHGARLGVAEALLAEGNARDAQIAFAQVSALEAGDRDRIGRALVGLAECALRLSDKNARLQAQRWVETVQERYGDTPAVLRAQELAKLL